VPDLVRGRCVTGVIRGRVLEALGGNYRVATQEGDVSASIRGRLKSSGDAMDRVVVGDRVKVCRVGTDGADWVVEEVLPRRSQLVRRASSGRITKVMAANLDRFLVVASLRDPLPSRNVIDRMLIMGEIGRLAVTLVLTKTDLPNTASRRRRLADFYGKARYPVLCTSVVTGEGMEAFRRLASRGYSALAGPSGVGKTSLLNYIDPSLSLRTLEVGKRSRSGRHATVSSRLVPLAGGGHVADLPGFSAVGPVCAAPGELDRCFPDFRPFLAQCGFRDCKHAQEPECAVRGAVADGRIQGDRYRSYRAILDQA